MTTTTYENRTYSIPAGLSLRSDGRSVACDDCRYWAYLGETLRHRKNYCDSPDLQAVDVELTRQAQAQAEQAASDVAEHGREIRRNNYAAPCEDCGTQIPAGEGELYKALSFADGGEYGRTRTGWAVRCLNGCATPAEPEPATAAAPAPSVAVAERTLGSENVTRHRTAVAVAARKAERKGGEVAVNVALDSADLFRAAQVTVLEDALVRAAVSWRRDGDRYLVTADPTARRGSLLELE